MFLKKRIYNYFDNQNIRDIFVINQLSKLKSGVKILDVGCGNQRYKKYCDRFNYQSQDSAQYSIDKVSGFADGAGGVDGYKFGTIDIVGNCWSINVDDSSYDAILCTEVLEHIPYPVETIKEFSRILKKGGTVILTAPSNCLRHMDPYFYYSGFSNHWFEKIALDCNLLVHDLIQVGDYYKWMAVEIGRTANHHSLIAKLLLFPAFIYYFFKSPSEKSKNTLNQGYHIVLKKS